MINIINKTSILNGDSCMHVNVKFKPILDNFFNKKNLSLIFLLLLLGLFFTSCIPKANGWIGSHTVVYNEAELRGAINTAPDNEQYNIRVEAYIVLEESLEIPENKWIGLSGGVLVGCDGSDVIIVKFGGTLCIQPRFMVTHVEGASGRGVYVERGGIFYLADGMICGNSAVRGGGVYNEGYFEVLCDGNEDQEVCLIFDNKADFGGGVYNVGTFITHGGEIFNNTATQAGGGVYNVGTFEEQYDRSQYSNAVAVQIFSNIALSGKGDNVFSKSTDNWLYLLLTITVVIGLTVIASLLFYRFKRQKHTATKNLAGYSTDVTYSGGPTDFSMAQTPFFLWKKSFCPDLD